MQSKIDFDNTIAEVDLLNTQAKIESENRTKKEIVYYKSIVLMLCAKLEKFVKDSANEYYRTLLSYNLPAEKWPQNFINEILDNEIETIKSKTINHYKDKMELDYKKNLSLFWDDKYIIKNLRDEFAISISNNGTTEFVKVYKKIGFPEIINELAEFEQSNSDEFGIETKISISITDIINRVIGMRNNIIHDDATPQITEQEIDKYINVFKNFVQQINSKMELELNSIKNS